MKRMKIAENNLTRYARRAALAACLVSLLPAMGCRSGRPGWNMFGRRGEPSAETLAGSGPTATYPVPPSSRATPEAIASIAGGTAPPRSATPETQAAPAFEGPGLPAATNPYALAGNRVGSVENTVPGGFPTSTNPPSSTQPANNIAAATSSVPPAYALPGRATPATAPLTTPSTTPTNAPPVPSYAAAAANGYPTSAPTALGQGTAAAATPSPTTSSAPMASAGAPMGYQLGSKSATPQPSTGFEMPPLNSLTPSPLAAKSTSPTSAATQNLGGSGGFTLPNDILPAPTSTASTSAPSESTATASLDLPPSGESTPIVSPAGAAGSSPQFQTAAKTTQGSTSKTSSGTQVQPAGYMPGSTSKATGYPSTTPIIR